MQTVRKSRKGSLTIEGKTMTRKKTRGKNFTQADRDVIKLLLNQDLSIRKIARLMNRGKSGVHTQIKRMIETGEIDQSVLDLGQANVEN